MAAFVIIYWIFTQSDGSFVYQKTVHKRTVPLCLFLCPPPCVPER